MTIRPDPDNSETVTDRTERIGAVTGNDVDGWHALDADGELIETFATRAAARKAIYERHRGEDRRG